MFKLAFWGLQSNAIEIWEQGRNKVVATLFIITLERVRERATFGVLTQNLVRVTTAPVIMSALTNFSPNHTKTKTSFFFISFIYLFYFVDAPRSLPQAGKTVFSNAPEFVRHVALYDWWNERKCRR